MTDIVKYGFYTVDPDYLEYLNRIDSEVYYTSSYRNTIKPFVGIVVGIGTLFPYHLLRKNIKNGKMFRMNIF